MHDNKQISPGTYDKEGNIKILEKVQIYLNHWKWILFSSVIFMIGGFVFNLTQPDIFEFKASVLIIDPNNQMSEMTILKELSNVGLTSRSRNIVNNEELVFKSTQLLLRVVNELKLHTIYEIREELHYREIYNESPFIVSMDSVRQAKLTEAIKLRFYRSDNKIVVLNEKNDKELVIEKFPAILKTSEGNIYIKRNASYPLTDEKIFVTILNPRYLAKNFAFNNIVTAVNKLSDDISLTIRTKNLQKGYEVLDALIRIYNKDAVEQINQTASSSSVFIDGRLDILNKELSSVEKDIENYKQNNQLTNIEQDATEFLRNNSDYYNQMIQADIQLQLMEYIQQYLNQEKNKFKIIPDLGLKDNGLIVIISEYNKLILLRDQLRNGTPDDNPSLTKLNAQILSTRNSIFSGMNNSRKALEISKAELLNQNSLLNTRLKNIPRQEREFVEIKRQQQVKESLYVFLLQKKEEASLSMAVATNKARLLNFPDMVKQVSPNIIKNIIIFMVIGLAFPILLIFLGRMINTRIEDKTDIEGFTKIPVLSELSHNKSANILFDHQSLEIENAELFRLLRAKLRNVMNFPEEKVILLTSTTPKEGKTFISVNLAVSLSLRNKKVLLIGMDLRKPMLTKIFNIPGKDGITSFLNGTNNDFHSLIHHSPKYPGLYILPSGFIPPNPNELIMDEKLDDLLIQLRNEFDYIIIDSAPVGSVSDTYLLDRVSDICLYVCRAGYTDKRNLSFINQLKEEGTFKKIYLLINDVESTSGKYSYYRYGYGYGYGYRQKSEN